MLKINKVGCFGAKTAYFLTLLTPNTPYPEEQPDGLHLQHICHRGAPVCVWGLASAMLSALRAVLMIHISPMRPSA